MHRNSHHLPQHRKLNEFLSFACWVLWSFDSQAEHQTGFLRSKELQNWEKTSRNVDLDHVGDKTWDKTINWRFRFLDLDIAAGPKDLILYRSGLRRELQGNSCNMPPPKKKHLLSNSYVWGDLFKHGLQDAVFGWLWLSVSWCSFMEFMPLSYKMGPY